MFVLLQHFCICVCVCLRGTLQPFNFEIVRLVREDWVRNLKGDNSMKTHNDFHILAQCHCRWLVVHKCSVRSFIHSSSAGVFYPRIIVGFFVWICALTFVSLSLAFSSSHSLSAQVVCISIGHFGQKKEYFIWVFGNFSIAASTTRQFDSKFLLFLPFIRTNALVLAYTHSLVRSFFYSWRFLPSSSSSNRSIEPSHYLVSVA